MFDRHKARLCIDCSAPMARQCDRCWRCDATFAKAAAASPRRSLQQSTTRVLSARARGRADGVRRARQVTPRASNPRSPKTSV